MLISNYYDFDSSSFQTRLLGIMQEYYPEKAVDFVLGNEVPGNMLNSFNSGAYLIGRAYPERKVFIDGRTEVYGSEFFQQAREIYYEGNVFAFESAVRKYNITAVLFNLARGSLPNLISHIYKDPGWKLVFFDESGMVFLKDTPLNKQLIKKYAIDFRGYSVPEVNLDKLIARSIYPYPYIRRASVFNLLEEDAPAILELKQALHIMPSCSKAYNLLGQIYLRKNQLTQARDSFRIAVLFAPMDVEAITGLGDTLRQLGKYRLAIGILKQAINIKPNYAPAYYSLGIAYLALEDELNAQQVLNKAVKYKPKVVKYRKKLAEALFEQGKRSKQVSWIMKAKEELILASKLNIQENQDLNKQIEVQLNEIEDYLCRMK